MLLKALLGEITPVKGRISSPAGLKIGYCSQKPWLMKGNVRSTITGMSAFDKTWYDQVIRACDLDTDISLLPKGDMTVVDANGTTFSGGQCQRLVCELHY
jgi:ATP-binding cassette, subfamily C (CFTR/MRP), member 1